MRFPKPKKMVEYPSHSRIFSNNVTDEYKKHIGGVAFGVKVTDDGEEIPEGYHIEKLSDDVNKV